jgi:hypothetical protein
MSAVATKKRLGDLGVLMTYPAIFSQLYDKPLEYFPSDQGEPMDIMVGRDFQSVYHEEKKADARRSVIDGLQARRSSELLMMTGHANYHLPKPVLGQRKFANPMNGVVGYTSSRRDGGVSAPFMTVERQMEGGILSSAEGQQYYRDKLAERSEQLTQINALAGGQPVPWGSNQSRTFDNRKLGTKDKVEFYLALRNLTDAVLSGGITSFNYSDFKDMLTKLFRYATYASGEELADIRRATDTLMRALQEIADFVEEDIGGRQFASELYAQSLTVLVSRIQEYLKAMVGGVNLQPQDRVALSQNLIRSLGFDRALLFDDENDVLRTLSQDPNTQRAQRARQRAEDFFDDDDGDGDVDEFDEGGEFSFLPPTREDAEAEGVPRAPFAGRGGDENRERFGARNGLIVYGGAPSYYGEGEAMAAPLGTSGVEPENQRARTDPDTLKNAAEAAISTTLSSLNGFREGMEGEELEAFITAQYPDTDDFVSAVVEALDEQGYTPPQIARGLEMTRLPFFAEYITENSGNIDPVPIAPAYDWSQRFAMLPGGGEGVVYPRERASRLETISEDVRAPSISEAQRDAWFAEAGLSRSRDDFLRNYRSIESLMRLGRRLPAPVGVYRVRPTTSPKNARETIIRKIRDRIDPSF